MLYKKAAVSLVELAVAIAILAILCAGVIVSRSLIMAANLQAVYNDIVDFTSVTTFFTSEYGCAPGDCPMAVLPSKIINATPSGCFNLSTTTGMGNALTEGNGGTATVLATPYISAFSTGGIIDSNAKRTCAFYEMQAFEPRGFGAPTTTASRHGFDSILGINTANAIGVGKLDLSVSNKAINNIIGPQITNINNQITANNFDMAPHQNTLDTCAKNVVSWVAWGNNTANTGCGTLTLSQAICP